MTIEQAKQMILEVDEDDGADRPELEYSEFLELMAREMQAMKMDEEFIEAFKGFGPENKEGFITKE